MEEGGEGKATRGKGNEKSFFTLTPGELGDRRKEEGFGRQQPVGLCGRGRIFEQRRYGRGGWDRRLMRGKWEGRGREEEEFCNLSGLMNAGKGGGGKAWFGRLARVDDRARIHTLKPRPESLSAASPVLSIPSPKWERGSLLLGWRLGEAPEMSWWDRTERDY